MGGGFVATAAKDPSVATGYFDVNKRDIYRPMIWDINPIGALRIQPVTKKTLFESSPAKLKKKPAAMVPKIEDFDHEEDPVERARIDLIRMKNERRRQEREKKKAKKRRERRVFIMERLEFDDEGEVVRRQSTPQYEDSGVQSVASSTQSSSQASPKAGLSFSSSAEELHVEEDPLEAIVAAIPGDESINETDLLVKAVALELDKELEGGLSTSEQSGGLDTSREGSSELDMSSFSRSEQEPPREDLQVGEAVVPADKKVEMFVAVLDNNKDISEPVEEAKAETTEHFKTPEVARDSVREAKPSEETANDVPCVDSKIVPRLVAEFEALSVSPSTGGGKISESDIGNQKLAQETPYPDNTTEGETTVANQKVFSVPLEHSTPKVQDSSPPRQLVTPSVLADTPSPASSFPDVSSSLFQEGTPKVSPDVGLPLPEEDDKLLEEQVQPLCSLLTSPLIFLSG